MQGIITIIGQGLLLWFIMMMLFMLAVSFCFSSGFRVFILVIVGLLAIAAASAQPAPVSEEAKILALKLGYILNGNSMVRWGSIDLPAELEREKSRVKPEPEPKKHKRPL